MTIDKTMLAALMPKKPAKVVEGFDCILYGDPKTGKTTTLDDPSMKVLLLDMEEGTSVLAGAPNVDIVKIDTLEKLNAYGELLKENKWVNEEGKIMPLEHGLVAADSITRLQDLVKSYVVRVVAPNRQREIKEGDPVTCFGARSDWGNFGQIISDLVKYFHSLTKRGERSINMMWIAHKDNKYEDAISDTKVTGTQIKMQGSSVPIVMSTVDGIFYMSKMMGKDKQIHYAIQTETIGITEAGVRQSKRDERLPKIIENPLWSEIFKKLGYATEPMMKPKKEGGK